MKAKVHYKAKAATAAVDNKDTSIASGDSVSIKAISYTMPGQTGAICKLLVDGLVVSASQMDKYLLLPEEGYALKGPATLRMQLDNSANPNPAFLGMTLYYEEL